MTLLTQKESKGFGLTTTHLQHRLHSLSDPKNGGSKLKRILIETLTPRYIWKIIPDKKFIPPPFADKVIVDLPRKIEIVDDLTLIHERKYSLEIARNILVDKLWEIGYIGINLIFGVLKQQSSTNSNLCLCNNIPALLENCRIAQITPATLWESM